MADAPYPELKKSHTMAHKGRPWTDHKPPPATPVWGVIEGFGSYHLLLAALELNVFDTLERTGPTAIGPVARLLEVSEPHLQALLDSLVALGMLEQYRNVYGLNDTAERYLTSGAEASAQSNCSWHVLREISEKWWPRLNLSYPRSFATCYAASAPEKPQARTS